jgi:Holliday junction resolvase RusA-like endonuclease
MQVIAIITPLKLRPIDYPVSVSIYAAPPDRRKRDIDNLAKPILDALTHAGVWVDDSVVADLFMKWLLPVKSGTLFVNIMCTKKTNECVADVLGFLKESNSYAIKRISE